MLRLLKTWLSMAFNTTDGPQQLPIGSFDEGLAVELNARERPADGQADRINATAEVVVLHDDADLVVDGLRFEDTLMGPNSCFGSFEIFVAVVEHAFSRGRPVREHQRLFSWGLMRILPDVAISTDEAIGFWGWCKFTPDAADLEESSHWFESGGGLFPLDALTISAINDPSDDPNHLEL